MNAFLIGFQATTWVPNTLICTNLILEAGIAVNESRLFTNNTYHLWHEKTLNWTRTISGDLADAFQECGTDLYLGFNIIRYNFNRFDTTSDLLSAFLQNLLGSVFSLQAIFEDIVVA
mmetsp:Transcript_36662/g.35443  ORF Transcript_36662/g.35443 Transcript_36662/m.35443 type:complete len:117 (-) Transcript_36662:778-1128(-)